MASFSSTAFSNTAFDPNAFFIGAPVATADCDFALFTRIGLTSFSVITAITELTATQSVIVDSVAVQSRISLTSEAVTTAINELTAVETKLCQ
jgi:hypothetical protein